MLSVRPKRNHYSSLDDVINLNFALSKELYELALIEEDNIEVDRLGKYLERVLTLNKGILTDNESGKSTNVRRLIKLYDWLKYGRDWVEAQEF